MCNLILQQRTLYIDSEDRTRNIPLIQHDITSSGEEEYFYPPDN